MKRVLLSLALLLAASPGAAAAQSPAPADTAWNGSRALDLIQRAQQRRAAANADSGLTNYRSDARIFVYFYLDRTDTGERNLVKTDQLALEVFWQSPDLVKQRIVGWRDEKSLPTSINYHLDHLTVVQENFGDEIRLGDGDEVTGVVHPAAPGAAATYEYRLADSLTLTLPGAAEPVRVYEVQVRPLQPGSPGFVGSVFVEQRAGDIVRMDFTFTESSYVDRYLDYINISLDNGLWEGRFWLPNQQRVEIRRRIPELDIPAGSVIRANMRIANYRFDEPAPPGFFSGPAVVALPRAQREAFAFEEDIHSEVREEGIGPDAELGQIRQLATQLLKDAAYGRSQALRLRVGAASDLVRYNRAEGVAVSAGAGMELVPGLQVGARGGWAFGAGHPLAALTLGSALGRASVQARFHLNELRDVGVGPVVSGALNTLSSVFAGDDFIDPFHASGGSLRVTHPLRGAWSVALTGVVERQRSAVLQSSFSFFGDLRPVRGIDETDLLRGGRLALERPAQAEAAGWWSASLFADGGSMEPVAGSEAADAGASPSFLKPHLRVEMGRRRGERDVDLRLGLAAGTAFGELPQQGLYLLGGRGTIPGYTFRSFGGDRFATLNASASAELWRPWLRGRVLAGAGWSAAGEVGGEALGRGGLRTTEGRVLPGVGVGVGIFHDIVRVDVARGLAADGIWEVIVEANPAFWDFL